MKNIAASIHQRLLNVASARGVDFNSLAVRYANERLLARLAGSEHCERFLLKGATMLLVWLGEEARRTRDLDLLGFGDPDPARIASTLAEVLGVDVADDAMTFDAATIATALIREEPINHGVRVTFDAAIGQMRIPLQVDVGFGDAVTPQPLLVTVPPILANVGPIVLGYARETAIAEKFAAMLERGIASSRMKDWYDVWLLSERFAFDGVLLQAVSATLAARSIPPPDSLPTGLSDAFAADPSKVAQWKGFVRKVGLRDAPSLAVAVQQARALLMPAWAPMDVTGWPPGGPWFTKRRA